MEHAHPGDADSQLSSVLLRTSVPGYRQLFALGVLGRPSPRFADQPRVTLRCQQLRALNLAFALIHGRLLGPESSVAVIGGGVAGVTVAAALCQNGCRVTVLERRPGLLPLQAGSTQRWLHPHIIDWPHPGSEQEEAGLPLLNWRAAPAGVVFRQLQSALSRHPLQVEGGVQELRLVPCATGPGDAAPAPAWQVFFHNRSPRFDAVILAVGFGAEQSFPEVEFRSYWDADNLDRDPVRPQVSGAHCFISGTGDGGLTDFIRARLYRFDHQDTFRAFIRVAADAELHRQLLALDEAAGDDPGRLAAGYETVRVPAAVDAFLRQRLHPQRSATLHGQKDFPYSPSASLLNRFIAARILRLDGGIGCSRYESRQLVRPIKRHAAGYRVQVADPGPAGLRYHADFDEVIIRHGTSSALALLPAPIAAACQQLATQFPAEPDPLRRRLWPPGFFGPEPAPLSDPLVRAAEEGSFADGHLAPAGLPQSAGRGDSAMLASGIAAPRFQLAGPPRVELPTRPSLYKFLCALFASATELEHFVANHFPDLARQFSSAMTFDQLTRLLLADRGVHRVPRAELLAALRQSYPEQAHAAEGLLQPQAGEP